MNKFLFLLLFFSEIYSCFSQRIIETVAGNGLPGYGGGEGMPAISSPISPYDIAIDKSDNIYFSESFNDRVCKIDHITGIITTVAGNGTQGFSGDGGPATLAQLKDPRGIALDDSGNLFVADFFNNRIRRIDAISGVITTVVGNGKQEFSGDGGLAFNAALRQPNDVAIDNSNNLYIADLNNVCIRKVLHSSGVISTIVGNGYQFGYGGDGSLATDALIGPPSSVAVDRQQNVYIADFDNNRIRKITVSNGIISTIAGTGELGIKGEGGPAISAQLQGPRTVEVDSVGNIYISELIDTSIRANIRRISKDTGIINSIIGNGTFGYGGDGGPAKEAKIKAPDHLTFDKAGNIYLADFYNFRIRKIYNYLPVPPKITYSDSCLVNEIPFHIDTKFQVYSVKWNFGDIESSVLNTSDEFSPIHKFSKAGAHIVTAVVESDLGLHSLNIIINVANCICQFEIPNVFTPNHDGYNDEYHVNTDCPLEFYQLSIVNRWGNEVFNSKSINAKWNGEQNGRECSSGVYFFFVSFKHLGFPLRREKGTLTLFR